MFFMLCNRCHFGQFCGCCHATSRGPKPTNLGKEVRVARGFGNSDSETSLIRKLGFGNSDSETRATDSETRIRKLGFGNSDSETWIRKLGFGNSDSETRIRKLRHGN